MLSRRKRLLMLALALGALNVAALVSARDTDAAQVDRMCAWVCGAASGNCAQQCAGVAGGCGGSRCSGSPGCC
jgi:hypothetical protein